MSWMFSVKEILDAAAGELVQGGRYEGVTGISIDSRTIENGECFVALQGAHYDGREFAEEAIRRGAKLIVSLAGVVAPREVGVINVGDPVRALGDISFKWRENFKVPAVAVTGSNGKSTTKQMITAALRPMGLILKTEGNFNNLIGLPLTILRWRPEHKAAVLEMGMNAPGEIARLTEIARPDVGLITNVSPAHLEYLDNIENVAKAKGELFETMRRDGTIVVNAEDSWVRKLSKNYRGKVFTYGMQNDCNVRFGRMESRGLDSIDMTIYVEGLETRVRLPVPGAHNVMNAMAAISTAVVLGVSAEEAARHISSFEPMSMRMEKILLSNGVQLVNDSYNANPLSVKEALRTVSGAKKAGRLVAVLGDMLELGKDAPRCHKEVGEAAAGYGVDMLFAFGDHAGEIASGASSGGVSKDRIEVFSDMEKLKGAIFSFIKTGDIVLVKGSRGMQMERVVEYLKDEIGVE